MTLFFSIELFKVTCSYLYFETKTKIDLKPYDKDDNYPFITIVRRQHIETWPTEFLLYKNETLYNVSQKVVNLESVFYELGWEIQSAFRELGLIIKYSITFSQNNGQL